MEPYTEFINNIMAHSYEDTTFVVDSYNVKKQEFDTYQSTHRIRLQSMQCKFNIAKNNFIYLYMKSMDKQYSGTPADHFTIGPVSQDNNVISIHATQYIDGIDKRPSALYCIIDTSNPDTLLEPEKPIQCVNNNVDIVRTFSYMLLKIPISPDIISRLRAFIRIGLNIASPEKSKIPITPTIPTPVKRNKVAQPSAKKSVSMTSTQMQDLRALRDSLRSELLKKGGGGGGGGDGGAPSNKSQLSLDAFSAMYKTKPKNIQIFYNMKAKTITLVFELPANKVSVKTVKFKDIKQ